MRLRIALVSLGALLGIAQVGVVDWVLHVNSPEPCLPYFLIRQEIVCGQSVKYIEPDGSIVVIGALADFQPMPRPRPLIDGH